MVYKLFFATIFMTLFTATIYDVLAYSSGEQSGAYLPTHNDEKIKTQAETIGLFIELLVEIDLDTPLVSEGANRLANAFAYSAEVIQSLEAEGDFTQAELYRSDIQNAFANHMQKPGASGADISKNIDAYSRYLTETLIAQANWQ